MKYSLRPVPPPRTAPIQQEAEELLLVPGLRAYRARRQFRCGCCHQMTRQQDWAIWVPDGIREDDPAWAVTEAARQGAYNGTATAWCLACARAFSQEGERSANALLRMYRGKTRSEDVAIAVTAAIAVAAAVIVLAAIIAA